MRFMKTCLLSDLVEIADARIAANDILFFVTSRRRNRRWRVSQICPHEIAFLITARADATIAVGDAPDHLHPLFLAAIIATKNAASLPDLSIPTIEFSTDEATRRSMTLNGMRMSTEFFANRSHRVLELVENRLAAGQRDVVHNILVYLMRRVFDIQNDADEARDLRAEALAAFLGLEVFGARKILSRLRPSDSRVAAAILNGEAGDVRRRISDTDLHALVANQMQILRPQLRRFAREEADVLGLIEEIVSRLRADDAGCVVLREL